MDACKACGGIFDQSEKCVLCSGLCGKVFHPGCVGLNVTNFKAWTANVGLLWFCDTCRVNFNPIVMNREAVIIKTMRDVLLRVDSLDLRVGQFGENLKTLNSVLAMPSSARRESNMSSRLQQFLTSGTAMNDSSEFFNSIDRLNLDSSLLSNVLNNTIADDVDQANITTVNEPMCIGIPATIPDIATTNATITTTASTVTLAHPATAFGSVTPAIRAPASGSTVTFNATAPANTATSISSATTVTTATSIRATAATTIANTAAADAIPASNAPTAIASTSGRNNPPTPNNPSVDNGCRLKVVSKNRLRTRRDSIDSALTSFYVTPFHNGQTVDDIIDYLREVINIENSKINCVKLVPRNKNIEECTFVSFKLSVSEDLVTTVGDRFYWPDGVEIREFRPKNDNAQTSTRPT